MERRKPVADGISRLLSTLAIVLALVGAVFLYGENQKLKKEVASLGELSDGSATVAKYDEQVKVWDAEVTKAIKSFAADSTKSLQDFDAAREARDDLYEDYVRISEERVAAIVRQQLQADVVAMKPVVKRADLQIAHTVAKLAEGENVPVRISNAGDVEAEIASVQFVPIADSQFETDLPPVAEADQVVIRFGSEHNNATKANHHKIYERSYLLSEQLIAAQDTVSITVEIVRNRNVGWGMKGDLKLQYNDGQVLTIPAIDAIFVPEKVDT